MCASLLAGAVPLRAQIWDRLSNPKIRIEVKHPPRLGLKIARIAFGPSRGSDSDQLTDALTQDFVQNGIEVIDRNHLNSILAEHNFSLSGYVDKASAAELGKILGPAALVFVNLQRNTTEKKQLRDPGVYKDSRGYAHTKFLSRTQAFVKASVQTIDLSTGRIFQAMTVEKSPLKANETFDSCCAEYPSEFELQDTALRQVVEEIHQQFLPWSEQTSLFFFDDKECDMRVALSLVKGGDIEGAVKQSEAGLERCKSQTNSNDKTLAHAHYNVGMSRFLHGDYDLALASFSDAQRVKSMDITSETMAEVNKARALNAALQKVEQQVAFGATLGAGAEARAAASGPSAKTAAGAAATGTTAPATATASASASGKAEAGSSAEERLKRLEGLFQKKLITKQEYEKKRAEILKEM
jgi:tetratricopeptide (TPR) repeat protein